MLLTRGDSGAWWCEVSVPNSSECSSIPTAHGPSGVQGDSTQINDPEHPPRKTVINIRNSDPHPPKQGRYVLQNSGSWERDKKQRASGTEGDHPGAGKGEMEIAPTCLLHHHLVLAATSRASAGRDDFCVLPPLASRRDHPIKTYRLP